MLEDAFVLCDGETIEAVGRMRDLPSLEGDVVEVDGRGLCAIPGLVDCHTHAAFGGDRVDEFSLRAAGASYEELHAAGGGILSTVRATRALGEDGLRAAVERHRDWMRAAGTTTFEAKSGYGLDKDTELASLRAIRDAGGIPTWLGAHAVPPEFADADAYLDFALAEVLPEAAEIAEAADVFLERGAFDAAQARRYLEACRDAGLALRLHGDQFTESGAIPLAIELGARSVDHLEATGDRRDQGPRRERRHRRPAPGERALPRPADAAGASARRRRRGDRARDRLQPGQRVHREPAARLLARCTQLHLSPAEALAACTVNAAHVLGRADRIGRLAPGYRADITLLDAPDWRYLAYHLGGPGRRQGRRRRRASLMLVATRKQRKRTQKERRHEYETVWIDGEGNESEEPPDDASAPARASNADAKAPQKRPQQRSSRATRTPLPPSWRRAAKRAAPPRRRDLRALRGPRLEARQRRYVSALLLGVLYTALFIPFTYYVDRFAYSRWQRKMAEQPKKR